MNDRHAKLPNKAAREERLRCQKNIWSQRDAIMIVESLRNSNYLIAPLFILESALYQDNYDTSE